MADGPELILWVRSDCDSCERARELLASLSAAMLFQWSEQEGEFGGCGAGRGDCRWDACSLRRRFGQAIWSMRSCRLLLEIDGVQAAFLLRGLFPPPATGSFVLAGMRGSRAWGAADLDLKPWSWSELYGTPYAMMCCQTWADVQLAQLG